MTKCQTVTFQIMKAPKTNTYQTHKY